jgi:hypothetical protein
MAIAIARVENSLSWDKELESYQGSIFMSSSWISVISKNQIKPVYLKFFEDDKPVGLLGGIEFPMGKGSARQLFFYSGIATERKDASLLIHCKTALYEYAQRSGYQRISLRSYDYHSYLNAFVGHFKTRERMEYVFYLDKDVEANFDRDLRRRVRKAHREGVIFGSSSLPEMTDLLFNLIGETYKMRQSKGYGRYEYLFMPFFSSEEIEELVKRGAGRFYYVEKDQEILSMQFVIVHKKKAYSILMGTSSNGYKEGAPSFLFYELAMTLRDQGYRYLNIGGVSRGGRHIGLKKFKDSLGAETVKSAEEVTNFIARPLSYLNPFLELKRFLINLKFMPGRIKKPFMLFIDLIIQKKDRY